MNTVVNEQLSSKETDCMSHQILSNCKVDVAKSLLKSLWLLSNSWLRRRAKAAECKRIPSIPATVVVLTLELSVGESELKEEMQEIDRDLEYF